MPVYIGDMTSEVTALDGEMPLTPAQVEALLRLLIARLEQRGREMKLNGEATNIRRRGTHSSIDVVGE